MANKYVLVLHRYDGTDQHVGPFDSYKEATEWGMKIQAEEREICSFSKHSLFDPKEG